MNADQKMGKGSPRTAGRNPPPLFLRPLRRNRLPARVAPAFRHDLGDRSSNVDLYHLLESARRLACLGRPLLLCILRAENQRRRIPDRLNSLSTANLSCCTLRWSQDRPWVAYEGLHERSGVETGEKKDAGVGDGCPVLIATQR